METVMPTNDFFRKKKNMFESGHLLWKKEGPDASRSVGSAVAIVYTTQQHKTSWLLHYAISGTSLLRRMK